MKSQPIKISQISNRFDVRVKLDYDRVLQFVGFYQSGVPLPPVTLVEIQAASADPAMYAYVDGRHRGAARQYLNLDDIEATIIKNPNDPAELYAMALEANWGPSPLPPTRDIGLRCYLLNNGQRIIEESDFMAFMMGPEMHRCLICGRYFPVSKEAARLAREHNVEIGCTPCMRKAGVE